MKLTIDRAALLKSLAHVQSVVERRNTIPILSNILIDARDDSVALTATDMDLDMVDRVACTVSLPGSVTAPAHTLYDIVRKLPDGAAVELTADPEKERVTVRAGRSTFMLPSLPVADFPSLASDDLPHNFLLPSGDLKALIDRTSFAISTEETRYYLNGIYLHATQQPSGPVLRGVATDGHRLARVELPLPKGADAIPGVILPRKMVLELRKLLDEADGAVSIGLSETRIRLAFGAIILSSKLIDGTFPDYERVIPTGNDKVLELNRNSFAESVDRVATISTEKSRAVKITLDSNSLTLTANSPDAGSAFEELEVSYTANGFEIGFNSRYLLDILKQVQGDVAQFIMADAASPTVVRDRADGSAIYVLMPMRV